MSQTVQASLGRRLGKRPWPSGNRLAREGIQNPVERRFAGGSEEGCRGLDDGIACVPVIVQETMNRFAADATWRHRLLVSCGLHVVQLCQGDCVVDIERCFPLSRSSFYRFEEFRFVDVPSRLAFRHPLGFEDPGLVIGDLLGRKAVRIGQRDSGVPDSLIENATTMPAPFVVSRPDPALAANREQLCIGSISV